jgi:hypothetical protein
MHSAGQRIAGRWQLVRLVGEGGMATVFEATDVRTGEKRAIKFLHEESVWNPEAVRRFYREAKAASAIGHPAIIKVVDVGRDEHDNPFIVMEYLAGDSLARRIKRHGALPTETAVQLIVQVLSGLDEAHRLGIVHRDVKPDNIHLVGTDAQPAAKLLDFGISRFSRLDSGASTMLTRTGAVLGTANYMAPEQARGDLDVDHRVDVFAAGAVLYEATTGVVAFDGVNYNQVMSRVLSGEYRKPSEVVPSFPPPLEAVICKALAPKRDDRYPTAAAMIDALVPLLKDPAVLGDFAPRPTGIGRRLAVGSASVGAALAATLKTRTRRLAAGLLAALVAVIGLAVWGLWPTSGSAPAAATTPADSPPKGITVPPAGADATSRSTATSSEKPAEAGASGATTPLPDGTPTVAATSGPSVSGAPDATTAPTREDASGTADAAPDVDSASDADAAPRRDAPRTRPDARRRDGGPLPLSHNAPF